MKDIPHVTVLDDPVREAQAISLARWAAARSGVIVIAPLLGTMAMLANQVYMIVKISEVYEEELTEKAALSLIGSLGGHFAGQALTTLLPFAPLQLPIAIGTTYALGKVVIAWLKQGKPDDLRAFKTVYDEAMQEVRKNVAIFRDDPRKQTPLGDEQKKFTE